MSAISLLTAFLALQGGATKTKFSIDVFLLKGSERIAVKGGESLTGEVTFKIVPQTTNPIQAIELYVGDDLRDTDGSTPYEFKLDTLAEEDGNIKLRFKGFTSEGENAEKIYTVTVNNGVSLGADVHVKKGLELLGDAKYDDAITEARIALKADKDSIPARLLLARANLAQSQYDKAQKFAEDVLEMDKKSREAKELLVSVNVQRAFTANSKSSGDRKEVIQAIQKSFTTAVRYRVEARDAELDGMSATPVTTEYLDAAIRGRRYAKVVEALEKVMPTNYKNMEWGNRLAFAYLMLNRTNDADVLLRNLTKFGEYDAYTFALQAITLAEFGDDKGSDEATKQAILNSPDSLGVRTAQAFIAIKRNKPSALNDAARTLMRDNENRAEAHYFAAALANRLNQLNRSRVSFEKAIRADAADHDMYIEQGNEAIRLSETPKLDAKDKDYQIDYARAMYTVALEARSNSAQALTGLTITALLQRKNADAIKFGEAATRAGANYACGWYAYATALDARDSELSKRSTAVVAALSKDPANDSLKTQRAAIDAERKNITVQRSAAKVKAESLDPRYLKGRANLNTDILFLYYNTAGRTPVVSPPSQG